MVSPSCERKNLGGNRNPFPHAHRLLNEQLRTAKQACFRGTPSNYTDAMLPPHTKQRHREFSETITNVLSASSIDRQILTTISKLRRPTHPMHAIPPLPISSPTSGPTSHCSYYQCCYHLTLDMLTKRVAEMKLPQLPLQQVAGQWQLLLETISYQHQTNSATCQNKATNHKDGCHKLKHNGWLPSQENLPPTDKQRGDGSCRPYKINMASTTNHPMPIAIADTGITTVKTRG